MFKPGSLHAALTAAIVDQHGVKIFERDPAKLDIWADKGSIAGRLGPARGFEYRYKLNVLLEGFTENEDAVVLTIVEWVRANQPDLLLNHETGNQAISFEVDVIDEKTVDLFFTLELCETVRVIPRDAGGADIVHEPEPSLENLLEGEPLAGAPARPPLGQVWFGDTLVLDPEGG